MFQRGADQESISSFKTGDATDYNDTANELQVKIFNDFKNK